MSEEPTAGVHVTYKKPIGQFESIEVGIRLSRIPLRSSAVLIDDLLESATVAVDRIVEQVRDRVEASVTVLRSPRPETPAQPRLIDSKLIDPKLVDAETGEILDAPSLIVDLGTPEPVPEIADTGKIGGGMAFGRAFSTVPAEWQLDLISDAQVVALNAGLVERGFKDHRRHSACNVLLDQLHGEDGTLINSTKSLTKAEASIFIDWLSGASHVDIVRLTQAVLDWDPFGEHDRQFRAHPDQGVLIA